MKWFITITLLAIGISLNAWYSTLLSQRVSSISRAMGQGYSSVADVWHQSPLIAWENPAMPAMHDGVAIGYTKDKLYPDLDRDTYFNSSIATIGYKGIGIMLPFYNASKEFGATYDTGEAQQNYEGEGNLLYWGHETYKSYGISFNPIRMTRAFKTGENKVKDNFNIAFGISNTDIDMSWRNSYFAADEWRLKTHSIDAGALVSYQGKISQTLDYEGSFGFKKYNLADKDVKAEDGYKGTMGKNDIFGAGMSISLPTDKLIGKDNSLTKWSDTGISLMLLGAHNVSNLIDEITSEGIELGFLDTIYLRGGYYHNQKKESYGVTKGFGIKLHYKDLLAFESNYANYPISKNDDQESWDFMLSINAMNLIDHN